jgi:hydroxymethylglutaryl-CoA lyase
MQPPFLSPPPQVLISGISTGLNLTRLMAAREPLRAGLPDEPLYSMTPEAGLPTGWGTGAAHD